MIVNPFITSLPTIAGTRILEEDLGLQGTQVADPTSPGRLWTIQWLYAPVEGRALGGIRAKAVDKKGFIAFINQRDLEVLLGYGEPGRYCPWTGKDYAEPGSMDWYGFCCDSEDLRDDLYEHENRLREELKLVHYYLPSGLEVKRRIHTDPNADFEELLTLLWDSDPMTGQFPDTRLETIERRWASVERVRMRWEYIVDGR